MMRTGVVLVVVLAACGDPVRRPDYFGEPLVSFTGRLVAPPPGYREGTRLQQWLDDVNGRGAESGTDPFVPPGFPHLFGVDFNAPPLPLLESQWEALPTTDGGTARIPI